MKKPENNIIVELKQLGVQLPTKAEAPMELPIGYFDNFSEAVLAMAKQNDLFSNLPKTNPFELPKGYFEDFELTLQAELATQHLPKTQVFTIPQAYFENMEAELKAKLVLEKLPKSMPFEVPQGYFETLDTQLLKRSKTVSPKKAEIRPFKRTYANIGIAASVLFFLAVAFGIFNGTSPNNAELLLSKVPDAEIDKYLQEHQNEFLSDVETMNLDAALDLKKLEQEVFENQLNNISDDELSNYL